MHRHLPKIADSEWRIMKLLWKKAPQTAEAMIGCLKDSTRWNPRTVKTLLNRLVKKSAISFTKNGRSYLYFPLVDEKECVRAESRSFIDRVYGGGLKPMLAAFIEEESLSKNEIEELKRILEKKGK
jgi:BlaI family transcriptional regulator, penicillinase repressor